MKKRFMSAFLAVIMLFSMLSTTAFAASSEEEALGEINIFNGGVTMSYLSINGRIREQIYTYYNRVTPSGAVKEIPAYCVNPNDKGVPQTVGVGESIKYLADEKAADPKVTGIIANGYPNRGLSELGLENKYHAYYATKMALWCYLLSHWDINNLKVNPNLTGLELERAQKILAAAKDIYRRGTTWTENLSPNVSCTPDRDVAYEVTVNGRQYKQQVFSIMEGTTFEDYDSFIEYMEQDVPANPSYNASLKESAAVPAPEEQIGTPTYYDEYGNEISEEEALKSRLKDKNGNVVCEYISRRSVVSLRYTPKDGTILPITVCTEEDLQEARQVAAVRHVIFGAAYCIECLAVVLVYFKKRAK